MSVFVNTNDNFDIEIAVGKSINGNVYCDVSVAKLKEVNDDLDEGTIETHTCTFRRPNFEDTVYISEGQLDYSNGQMRMNPIKADFRRLARLIKAWTFKDEQGELVPVTEKNVASLAAEVAEVLAYSLNNKLNTRS